MLNIVKGHNHWQNEVTRMSKFDLQMAICLDTTEQSFARLLKEVFLRFLSQNIGALKEIEMGSEMKKSLQGVDF